MIRRLYIHNNLYDYELWSSFLEKSHLKPEELVDETYGLFLQNNLIATVSIFQNVIKCVAVDDNFKGGSVLTEIITHVINRIFQRGFTKISLYTTPKSSKSFEYLGFKKIESVDNVLVFMEKAVKGLEGYLSDLSSKKINGDIISSIVMNANPFTNGHLFLVEQALKISDHLHIFVLSEDVSVFPLSVRMKLVKEGTNHLKNISYHFTDNYMVSSSTFPSYFLEESEEVTTIQARLDAKVFANYIVPTLNITHRFVGTEPTSKATHLYNKALNRELSSKCKLIVIERLETKNQVISASKVRELLSTKKIEDIKPFVPKTTFNYLNTSEGLRIISKMKEAKYENK